MVKSTLLQVKFAALQFFNSKNLADDAWFLLNNSQINTLMILISYGVRNQS